MLFPKFPFFTTARRESPPTLISVICSSVAGPHKFFFLSLLFSDLRSRYSIYAAIKVIVTNHYRPRQDDSELDARKVLTRSLAQLATKDEVELA